MTALSTHVLDLTHGRPAANVGVRLYRHDDGQPVLIAERQTDADGRARLVEPGQLIVGTYRLAFEIGDYFAGAGVSVTDPPFLDVVVIDFAVADAGRAHHVPLLVGSVRLLDLSRQLMDGVIRYWLDGEVREAPGVDPTMTVLEHLRGDLRPDRNQGGLRRGRLRRLHRGGGRTGQRGRRGVAGGQRLHPVRCR